MQSINRRAVLKAAGVSLALPWLEAMSQASPAAPAAPVRFGFTYVPFGTNRPGWFPTTEGRDYQLPLSLEPIAPIREDVSVISGLEHIRGRTDGHNGCMNWLTGTYVPVSGAGNTVSIDQVIARQVGHLTRHPSLQVAAPLNGSGSVSLSYDIQGRPLPPLRSPAALFDRLFPAENAAARARRREQLRQDRSILDLVNDQAKSLRSELGAGDSRRMDAYLDSVRDAERRVQIAEGFIDTPAPKVNRSDFQLTATDVTTMIDTYLDLVFLAFRTDQTRIFTFPFAMDMEDTITASGLAEIAGHTGTRGGVWHEFGHAGDARCQRVDRWCVERVVRFARKLKETQEGDGTMLDRTMLVHGGSQVRTHDCSNFPILLLGGKGLGVRQGEHRRYRQGETPFSSLFVTMMARAGIPVRSFSESSSTLAGL